MIEEGTVNVGHHEVKAASLVFATAGKHDRPKLFPTVEVELFKLHAHGTLQGIAEYDIAHHINGHMPDQDRVAAYLMGEDGKLIECVVITFKCRNQGYSGLPDYVRCGYLVTPYEVDKYAYELNQRCWKVNLKGEMSIPSL